MDSIWDTQRSSQRPKQLSDWFKAWHSSGLLKLTKIIDYSPGFNLCIVEYHHNGYRDRIMNHLNTPDRNPESIFISSESPLPFSDLEKKLSAKGGNIKLSHIFFDQLLPETEVWRHCLQGFNSHRELISEKCRFTILLWMSNREVDEFAAGAPDMRAWRSVVVDFTLQDTLNKYNIKEQ